jgi:hypothetical protein
MMQVRATVSLLLALLVAGSIGPDPRPLDGGLPLMIEWSPDSAQLLARDPCWRRERGGWHFSMGHCEAMSSPEPMTGVWVTAFEESSYFPGVTALPDPNDPLRFTQAIELDESQVERLAGPVDDRNANAYLLSFVGRRTRDPYSVDCRGTPYFSVVVDRLIDARHLGPMGPFSVEGMMARTGRVERRHSGRWGQLEAEAIEHCPPPSGETGTSSERRGRSGYQAPG